ncbi:hypothetical protein [Pontibacter ruber]|uniref:Uncharacterized protein n=1 Tax=Pontibacter ruber TaxID=1343895 RepID=A0ABW5CYS7_9BACT|nr:hypothetical protein [Pontibacter ruber]
MCKTRTTLSIEPEAITRELCSVILSKIFQHEDQASIKGVLPYSATYAT